MAEILPLVVYHDGARIVVGEVEIFGKEIGAVVTRINPNLAEDVAHLSAETDANTQRRNVFEQGKD